MFFYNTEGTSTEKNSVSDIKTVFLRIGTEFFPGRVPPPKGIFPFFSCYTDNHVLNHKDNHSDNNIRSVLWFVPFPMYEISYYFYRRRNTLRSTHCQFQGP